MDNKDFLAIWITSQYSDYQLPSTTSNWCAPTNLVLAICDNSTQGTLSDCRIIDLIPEGCSGGIVYKDNFITFETGSQNRRGYVEEIYYTFKYTKDDFYLHQYSFVSFFQGEEGKEGMKTKLYYRADKKNGYNIRMRELNFGSLYSFKKEYEKTHPKQDNYY